MNPSLAAEQKPKQPPGRVIQTALTPVNAKHQPAVPENTLATLNPTYKTPSRFDSSPAPYVAPPDKKGPLLHISAGLKRAEITPPQQQAAASDGRSSAQEDVQYQTAQSKFNESEFYSA